MSKTVQGTMPMYRVGAITLNDNDSAGLPLDVNGNLIVAAAVGASFGASSADQSTFTPASTKGGISMGVYETNPETLTNNQAAAIGIDINRNTKVVEQYAPGYEDNVVGVAKVEQRFNYTHVAAGQATTVIKPSAGFLHLITLNGAATATNVTTVYDNPSGSGTVIAIPAATTATVPTTLTYDVLCPSGITIITTIANGADMTVSWR